MKKQHVTNTVPVVKGNGYPCIDADGALTSPLETIPQGAVFKIEAITSLDVVMSNAGYGVHIMVSAPIFMKFFKYLDGE